MHDFSLESAMKKTVAATVIGAMCSFALMLIEPSAGGQPDNPEQQEGTEALTRGPLHEAYAAPQSLDPKPSPIVPKQPPEPVPEMPPDQKPEGSHVAWISGYWAWDDDPAAFVWVSGFWRDLPPGKRWVPGHWTAVDGGSQWSSGFWADEQQTAVNYLPPPPPTLETGPSTPAPEADQFYSPGNWVYVERQYRWRPGFWLSYRPGWVYVPAHWDYELTHRGLLFCPVRFTANVWTRPGWRLRPHYIVYPEVIVGALFVRIDYHRYCFGDYFGDSFVRHGFIPWVDYRLHRNIPEPLFHQYAWSKRGEVNWERDLRRQYDDRRVGIAPRPPRTVAQQQQFMRDLAEHKAIKVGDKTFAVKDVKFAERNLMMVNPLTKVDRKVVTLKTLTPAAHAEVLKTIEHHAAVKQERTTTTLKILKDNPPLRPTDPHVTATLPAIPQHLATPGTVTIPKAPMIPPHVEKVIPKYTPPAPTKTGTKPLQHGSLNRPADVGRAPCLFTVRCCWFFHLVGFALHRKDRV
jgi:hypothetical protein